MSESDFNSPIWSTHITSTVTPGPDSSASRFNATQTNQPMRHRRYNEPYSQFLDFSINHLPDFPPATSRDYPQAIPNPYDEGQHRPPVHFPSYSGVFPHLLPQPPVPRQPVFSPNRPAGTSPELAGLGNIHNLPSHPLSAGFTGFPQPYSQGYNGRFAPANTVGPSLRHYHYAPLDQQPALVLNGGHEFEPPARESPDRPRLYHPLGRRSSQQGSRQHYGNSDSANRPYDRSERRASRLVNAQGRLPDGNASFQTSGRRPYDSFIHDISRAMTSSDAEEAAARVPPSFRARRLPREPRLRFSSHGSHQDPNLATPRQMQELKDKLPRRLPSELPEGTSTTCDICSKDYSSTHVQPCESDEIAIELPCGHCFGEFCIIEWFTTCRKHKNKVTCPMCRKQLIEPSRYHPALLLSAMTPGDPTFEDMLAFELR